MNRDLMMKAAVKFKGVWPDEEEFDKVGAKVNRVILHTRKISKDYPEDPVDTISLGTSGANTDFYDIITRDQFEAFVESLFEGAPEDATHRGKDNLFYRLNGNSAHYWNYSDKWARDVNGREWLSNNLIPRPARVEPEAPYMPKVGEECEYKYKAYRDTFNLGTVDFIGDKLIVITNASDYEQCYHTESLEFRPLRTERELFIERAIEDYIDQVGSDAVNAKWFERIFGALYDAGYKKN